MSTLCPFARTRTVSPPTTTTRTGRRTPSHPHLPPNTHTFAAPIGAVPRPVYSPSRLLASRGRVQQYQPHHHHQAAPRKPPLFFFSTRRASVLAAPSALLSTHQQDAGLNSRPFLSASPFFLSAPHTRVSPSLVLLPLFSPFSSSGAKKPQIQKKTRRSKKIARRALQNLLPRSPASHSALLTPEQRNLSLSHKRAPSHSSPTPSQQNRSSLDELPFRAPIRRDGARRGAYCAQYDPPRRPHVARAADARAQTRQRSVL